MERLLVYYPGCKLEDVRREGKKTFPLARVSQP